MTAAIFLVAAVAMIIAVAGRRDIAVALLSVGFIASVLWLYHHMTDPLALSL